MKLLAAIALLAVSAFSQTVYNAQGVVGAQSLWHTLPAAVPTSPTDVRVSTSTRDVYVTFIKLTNDTAGALTCSIYDKQTVPVPILSATGGGALSIAAGTTYVIVFPEGGVWAPGGVRWNCSGVGVFGYIKGTTSPPAQVVSTTGD